MTATKNLIDQEIIDSIIQVGGRNLLISLVDIFTENIDDYVANIRSALHEGDAEKLAGAVHVLRSSTGSLGALGVVEMVDQIEAELRAEQTVSPENKQEIEALLVLVDQVHARLREICSADD